MKKLSISKVAVFFMLLLSIEVCSQDYTLNKSSSTITVSGTSSLHDWDVISNDFTGHMKLQDVLNGKLESLYVNVNSETLKSGKKAMDKKTYKALRTDEFPNVTFSLNSVKSQKRIDNLIFEFKLTGDMSICGVTNSVPLDFLLTLNGDRINITGSCIIKMTDFKIEPPTALLGTIKTGDQITIKFNSNFIKKRSN
ncbi:YceI family protein [Pontimicrobium sp. SW4]|uniref:YceI family protein n=1 Tax=Pontimicrobium sp. SW4 TaxID=3153519 RepID=A0AAU7BVX1_9FLAO